MRDEVLKALKGLEDSRGKLHADEVVAAARPEDSALHGLFTWDDAIAAAQRRLEEARGLIRSYRVAVVREVASGGQRAVMMRKYVADRMIGIPSPPGTYSSVTSLTTQEQGLILLRIRREVRSMAQRYRDYPEFWQELAEVIAEHEAQVKKAAASG